MKKFLIIISCFLFLISSVYSFNVLDSSGDPKEYFSVNSPNVFIETSNFSQNFSVSYQVMGSVETSYFNLQNCTTSSNYCGQFNIVSLAQNVNGSFVGATEFNISLNNQTKKVYFDFENPIFELISSEIDKDSNQLKLNFNYSDNISGIDRLQVFRKDQGSQFLIANTTSSKNLNVPIESRANIVLLFRLSDKAGNFVESEHTFPIPDIFAPTITDQKIINEFGNFRLYFRVTDDDLDRYEIIQGDLSLRGTISGSSYSSTVNLPFDQGKILLKVYDKEENFVEREIDLNRKPFDIRITNPYSNERRLKLDSNSNMCRLIRFDGVTVNRDFVKDSNRFSIDTQDSRQKQYNFEVYCETNDYRLYQRGEFVFDVTKPSAPNLSGTTSPRGYVSLNWSESEDLLSGIDEYVIYKDNRILFSVSDLRYNDISVRVDDEYEYFIRAYDRAGNFEDSNIISVKVEPRDVEFMATIPNLTTVENSTLRFSFDPISESLSINIKVSNSNQTVQEFSRSNLDQRTDLSLNLVEGENIISLLVSDRYGNSKQREYYINYTVPVILDQNSTVAASTSSNQQSGTASQVSVQVPQEDDRRITIERERPSYGWLWWFVILLIIAFFVVAYILFKPELSKLISGSNNKKSKKKSFHLFHKNSMDRDFERHLNRIRAERVKRQEEIKREKQREIERKKREQERSQMSEFQKEKQNDLANRRELVIPFEKREKARKRINRIRKEAGSNAYSEMPQKRDFSKKDPDKEKNFLSYINKVRETSAWSNPSDYRHKEKPQPKEEVKQDNEVKEKKVLDQNQKPPVANTQPGSTQSEVKQKPNREPKHDHIGLNEYLGKRSKKKSRFFHLFEREVERDINTRFKK